MINTIIFDWGGVIIDCPGKPLIDYFARRFCVTTHEFTTACQPAIESYQRNEILEKELWEQVGSKLERVIDTSTGSLWKAGIQAVYSEKAEMIEIISSLYQNGYRLALLSNTETPTVEFFHEKKYPWFEKTIFSCEVGLRKPDEGIYQLALDSLSITPQQALFVDDRLENIQAAERLGIKSHHFQDVEGFRDALNQKGLSI